MTSRFFSQKLLLNSQIMDKAVKAVQADFQSFEVIVVPMVLGVFSPPP